MRADKKLEQTPQAFEEEARRAVRAYSSAIVMIPDGVTVNPDYLGGLSNREFVETFRTLQEMIIAIYSEIEKSPYEWGWPDWRGITVDGNQHNRVSRILSTLVEYGELNGNELTLDKKDFNRLDFTKKNKGKLMLYGLGNMGFSIEGLDDKGSETFTFSCPDSPNVIPVLYAYYRGGYRSRDLFSYRFVQEPTERGYDARFISLMDKMPVNVREIHYWLHDESAKYGFTFNEHNPGDVVDNDCIWYERGAKPKGKEHMRAAMNFEVSGIKNIHVKMLFSRIFQSNPTEAGELLQRFSDAFNRKKSFCKHCVNPPCKRSVEINTDAERRYCHHHSFHFDNVSFDDIKTLFRLYIIDNKLKKV
jgi:hypothetical protein